MGIGEYRNVETQGYRNLVTQERRNAVTWKCRNLGISGYRGRET